MTQKRRVPTLLALLLAAAVALASDPRPPTAAAAWLPGAPAPAANGSPSVAAGSFAARAEAAVRRFARLGLPLYCGGARGRFVALTFDDGPGPYTRLALRILRRVHAHATFFLVGRNLARWPWAPRAEERLGVLGDHTWTHAYLPALGSAEVETQIARTRNAIESVSGMPVELFRPPYGAHDRVVDAQVRWLGMLEVLWSIDTRDSEGAPWYEIAATVRRELRPGAIVLMHENHGQTIRALKFLILPLLHRRGYRTITVPQLLALDPPGPRQLRGLCFGSRSVPHTPGD